MRILVTGATGFIGSRLVEKWAQEGGHEIFFCGRSSPRDTRLQDLGACFVRADLSDPAGAETVAKGMDVIVHGAGKAGTWGPESEYHQANVVATENLLNSARAHGASRFIHLSSPSISFDYKDQFDVREEDRPRRFSNAYAKTKWEAEQKVRRAHGPGFQTVSLRPRSVLGRGDQNVLPRLLQLQKRGGLVQVGHGENVVDLTTVGNLLDAIDLCLRAPPEAMGETYNITNGEPMRFWDFVEMVMRKARLPARRRRLPYWPVMLAAHANQGLCRLFHVQKEPSFLPISVGILSFSMTLDITKARERLGYRPRFTTEQGVDEFLASL